MRIPKVTKLMISGGPTAGSATQIDGFERNRDFVNSRFSQGMPTHYTLPLWRWPLHRSDVSPQIGNLERGPMIKGSMRLLQRLLLDSAN